jgi:hypothetical protein
MRDEDKQIGVDLRLSAQRALWGQVPATLRAVSLEMRETTILFRAVFEPSAPEADREMVSVAATEVVADFSAPTNIEEEFLDVAPPAKPPHLRHVVYLRSEPHRGDDTGKAGQRVASGLSTDDLRALDWSDASFSGFGWESDGKDLRLFLAHASQPIGSIRCAWASDLQVDLRWERPSSSTAKAPARRGGHLLTQSASIERTSAGRWVLFLDFGHEGDLRLECDDIAAEIGDAG